jgi:HK97 family phage major capsid protein
MATQREQFEKAVSDLKSFAEELDAKGTPPSAEDLERVNALGADVKALHDGILATATATGTVDMAKAFIADLGGPAVKETVADQLEQRSARTGIVNPNGMTLGEAMTKSPAYEQFVKQFRGADGGIRQGITIGKGAEVNFEGALSTKALVTGLSDTSGGAFVTTERLGVVSDLVGQRRLTVRDLCTNITISSDTFDYVTVTGKTNAAAPVLEATTSATPGLNNVAVGAYTAAHGVKPESALTLAVVSAPVETIAHLIPITRRAAADAPQVRALIDAFLLYGLAEEEEDQLLNGSGTSPNLRGLYNVVGINTVGSAGTDIDAVVDAISAIRTDMREPTGLVIHPDDWFSTGFLTAKDTAGNYLIGDPTAPIDQQQALWGLRVVVTPAATANTALVGDFRQAIVADRMQSAIYVTDSHNDWFARNLLAVLAEERLAFGCLDPEAFCTITAV